MKLPLLAGLCLLVSVDAAAADGRLLGTGGVTQVEGAAGGGLVPWAVIAGHGAAGETSGTAFLAHVATGDYQLDALGAAWSWSNRLEVSLAHQNFDLGTLGIGLASPDGVLRQNVAGAKLRLFGDVVYGAAPQFALGVQHKRTLDFVVPAAVGAADDTGTDIYMSAAKLHLAPFDGRNWLWNLTLRATKANQLGLLGFGGDRNEDYELMLEGSLAVMLDRRTLLGIEYRQKPDNLSFGATELMEDDWADVFIAYLPSKSVTFTAAYARLGTVATLADQSGFYLSVQAVF